MADIFEQMDSLFRNQTPEGAVHCFVLHRFLASDKGFAPVAKDLAMIYDDSMVTEIWRGALPKLGRAPRLKYAAPKKPAAPPDLVKKVADHQNWTLPEAEAAVSMVIEMGHKDALFAYFGLEEEKKEKKKK